MREFFLRMLFVGVLLAALTLLVMAQGDPEAAKVKNPVSATPESLATGQAIYQRYCAVCHGKRVHKSIEKWQKPYFDGS